MKLLAKRVGILEAQVSATTEISDEEFAKLLMPVLESLIERKPLPCSEQEVNAVIKRYIRECEQAPPIPMKALID